MGRPRVMLDFNRPKNADFLAGGGEMGALTRVHDWSATAIGPPDAWPQSLRTAVRILLNTNHPMFIWWGPELIQFYNDAYRQTMGPERHPSALGARGRDCWAEIWPIIGPQIEQVMSGGGATWHENQLVPVTRHGRLEQVWWTYGYSPIDEADGVGGVLVVCRDVTEEHLAAKALREREAELARVQQIGRIGGLEVDLRTGFRNRRSPEYLLIHGLPPDAVNESHEDWVRRIHPDDREATEKKFRDAVAGDVRDYTVRYRIIRPNDGELRWISVKSTIERDENGKAVRLVGAHSDITEQVEAERALQQSEAEQRKLAGQLAELNATLAERVEEKTRERDRIWNVSQDLLLVADRNGVWQTVNPAWTRTLGWSEAELLNRTSQWLEHPDDGGVTRAQVKKLSSSETTVRFESRFRHKDGSYRWLSWTGVSDKDRIYAVARDVTAEKAATDRLKATEEALRQSQKMEAVGPTDRRHRARFQQSADRDRRLAGSAADPARSGTHRKCRTLHQCGDDVGQPRRGADPSAAGVRAAPAADSEIRRRQCSWWCRWRICCAGPSARPSTWRSSHRRAVVHAVRSEPARKCAAQSRHQRARRHARRRQARHRHRECADRGHRCRYAGAAARRLHPHRRRRHRHRHEPGSRGARLRPVLHHQADRAGHRARAVDDLRFRAAIQRPCADRQQAGRGNVGPIVSAAP